MHETVQATELVWAVGVLAGAMAQVALWAAIANDRREAEEEKVTGKVKQVFGVHIRQVVWHSLAKICGLVWVGSSLTVGPTPITEPKALEEWMTFLFLTGMIWFPACAGWQLWYDRHKLRSGE